MSKAIYAIYGLGGFAREIAPLIKEQINNLDKSELYFIIDKEYLTEIKELNGSKIIDFDEFVNINSPHKYLAVGFSNIKRREEIYNLCKENSIKLLDVKASNVVVLDHIEIGEGSILCPFVTLTSNIKIGRGFQANIYSYVAHDCIIGDYVTFAPAVKCNGNVHIEDYVYIGAGAIIHPGKSNKPLVIGKGAVIAAGAVVTKSIPAGITVFGNPAVELTKENMKRRR